MIQRPPIKPRQHLAATPSLQLERNPVADLAARGIKPVILNNNEGPFPPFPEAQAALEGAISALNRYPEPSVGALKEALAARWDLQPQNVALDAGSTPLIFALCTALLEPGDEVVFPWPSFPVYRTATARMLGQPMPVPLRDHRVDTRALLAAVTDRTRIVVICNPNNPTGTASTRAELDELLDALPPGVVALLDEAYAEFADDYADGFGYIRQDRPVLLLRTFSKLYGLAGLRVGYGFGPADVIDAVRRVQLPYNVNAMSQAAALASVNLADGIRERIAANAAGRRQLCAGLDLLGIAYAPSQTNFVWVHLGPRGPELVDRMAELGVLVRAGRGYDEPEYARVTIGLPEENDAFLAALERSL